MQVSQMKDSYHSLLIFSGSVDTIVFYKTGNHLPQRFWGGVYWIVFHSGWLH